MVRESAFPFRTQYSIIQKGVMKLKGSRHFESFRKTFSDDRIFDFLNKFILCIFVFLVAYPLLYVIFASISSGRAVDTGMVTFFPVDVTLSAYREVAGDMLFWRSYGNSVLMTVLGTIYSMVISMTGAYALSRKHAPGSRVMNFFLVFTMWFSAGTVPIYLNLQGLNLLNFGGLIIGFGISAFSIIILRSAYITIPSELQDAAKIDGANEFQNFFLISTPNIKPTIATVWLLYGIGRWNGFFWAMIIITDLQWMPLQVYLRRYIVQRTALLEDFGLYAVTLHSHQTIIYAIIVCSIIPIFIVFPFMQRVFQRGVMEGGLKG